MVTTPDQRTLLLSQPVGKAQLCVTATVYTLGKSVLISVTAAGTVTITLADGSTIAPSFPIGVFHLPFAATTITNGTATATYYILY